MRFRRALDRGNVTEALSAASELQFGALAEARHLSAGRGGSRLSLTLLSLVPFGKIAPIDIKEAGS
jgi:hypothetical protein